MSKIHKNELSTMFEIVGVSQKKLYDALLQMNTKHLKTKRFKDEWSQDNPTRNYCYVVSEFVWFYLAPKGTTPYGLTVEGDAGLHRYLKYPDGSIIDLTAEQFDDYYNRINYSKGKVRHFLQSACTGPSMRAKVLAELMGYNVNNWSKPNDREL